MLRSGAMNADHDSSGGSCRQLSLATPPEDRSG
jgi:hypothetical protein